MKWVGTGRIGDRIGRSREGVRLLLEADHRKPMDKRWFPSAYKTPGGQWRAHERDIKRFLDKMRGTVKRRSPVYQTPGTPTPAKGTPRAS